MSAPLILAIHPDRRQAPKLASIARHASAELLLAESMGRAIAMLSERLPDLILTPTLLSHRDETALTERLRELGDVAAHVQTLTIPIFETAASTSRKGGVLSSLRKPKRKGKSHAAETVGCTLDTFAEQVSIYLSRAVEARIARPAVQAHTPEPEPEPTHEAQTQNAEGPAKAGHYVPAEAGHYVPSKAGHYVHERQKDEPYLDTHQTADGLPTIEELSARTPAVPEPDRSVERRMDVITAMVPAVSTIVLPPAAPVETSVKAITIIERSDSIRAQDCPVPAAVPRVAELFKEMRSLERAAASGRVVHALPAPAALVPVVKSAAAAPPVPIPALPPRVAELATHLLRAETDSHIHATAPVVPALPTGSVEMSMATVAAMVPVSTVVGERVLPTPIVASPLTELRMELPPMAATGNAALPIVPESGGSASVEALAAMASVVGIVGADRPMPMPAATPPVADLAMTLPSAATAFSTQAVAPVVPESGRSVEVSMQVVAGIAPFVADQAHHALAPIPATATRVAELAMKLPSPSVDANAPVLPELPTRPIDAPADAVAAIMPLARAAAHQGVVPAPAVVPYVVELPMPLQPMAAAGPPQDQVLRMPQTPAAVMRTDTGAIAAVVEAIPPSTDEGPAPPAPSPAPLPLRRKAKKKPTLQERKAARKNGRKPDRLDDESIFDPDECRFAALVAKLDEVVLRGDDSHAAGFDAGQQPRGRKTSRSSKKH